MNNKNTNTLAEIGTHKAVKENGRISIYLKGMDSEAMDTDTVNPKGERLFNAETVAKYPEWFTDEKLYTIALDQEDDVFAIMERYAEDNRINLAEANA